GGAVVVRGARSGAHPRLRRWSSKRGRRIDGQTGQGSVAGVVTLLLALAAEARRLVGVDELAVASAFRYFRKLPLTCFGFELPFTLELTNVRTTLWCGGCLFVANAPASCLIVVA